MMQINQYPHVRRGDVVDNYHGTLVADPYRWLEDPDSAETQAFVVAQSELTQSYLDEIPGREQIRQRLTELNDYERVNAPQQFGEYYFFWKNSGLQNQPVLYRQLGLEGQAEEVLNPNEMSEDGTAAITAYKVSKDATKLAYVVTHGGSDWQEIRIRNLETQTDYEEVLQHGRFPQIAWHPDGSGFFYNGHLPTEDLLSAETNKHNKLFWHTLGTEQSADTIIYERPDQPEWNFPIALSDDEQYLFSMVWSNAVNRNRVYYRKLADDGPLQPLIDEDDHDYRIIGNVDTIVFIRTDNAAPNYRIIAIDLEHSDREQWREIVPEQADALAFATIVNQQFVLGYMHNAHHQLKRASLDGDFIGTIELPTLGSIVSLQGKSDGHELFVDFYSFLYPTTALRYDFVTDKLSTWHQPQLQFNVEDYETKLVFATSADGTQVPVFITHHQNIELNGQNPTILYGYGGYSINMSPRFSTSRLQWLEMGCVFAQAALRGGAEYGERWHRAGMLENKQNVFDDFIASAETLIELGYTSSRKLAIQGGSNGGLLVAACMVQRPDLFGAVLCHVPVLDMLRYQRFTAGRYWISEYGNVDDPDQFAFMHTYSPLHNVDACVEYPPTLILTADRDDRVVPMHAHKFAATVQHHYARGNPILLRFELSAGHGFGKSTSKLIDEATDVHAFLTQALDIRPNLT